MWRKSVVLLFSSLMAGSGLLAQAGSIAGTVTSAEGARPIAGAQVHVLGSSLGAITNEEGRYAITTVPPGTYRLRVTRIGYSPDSAVGVVVTTGATATANFQLQTAAQVLSQVVVIGYGTQQARDLTGSVATVTPRTFNAGVVVAPEELIRGKVPGVQVVDNNEPGGGIAIRIRGGTSTGSFGASNDPLYVIDGVPITVGGGASAGRNPLNFLNPKDIASITVLKDASSTAIYGSRAANGVVIITTKTGGSGPQFTYDGNVSGSRVVGGPDLLNATQFRAAVQQYAPNRVSMLGNANTNWLGAVEQNAGGTEHNIGLNGQREDMSYRLGLGYLNQNGVLQGTQVQRYSGSINYSDRLFNSLKITTHVKGSRTNDNFTPGGVIGSAIAFAPTQPITTDSGSYFEYRTSTGGAMTLVPTNPLEQLSLIQQIGNTLRSVGNLEAEYAIPHLTGLTATVRGGYDLVQVTQATFTPTTLYGQSLNSNPGDLYRNNPAQQTVVLDAYGKYSHQFDPISSTFDITGGFSAERFRGDYSSFNVAGLSTNLLGLYGVPAANEPRPSFSIDESQLRSGFARANWNLLDRYLLTGTIRRDGSSRFAVGNQYGTFPSVAFAWRLIDEPSLRNRLPVSDLKLRASWGKNGNQPLRNYISYGTYTYGSSTAEAQLGNQFVPTIRPVAFDPNLKWETTASTNLGFDYGFASGRFTGTVDYYTKKTTDLLFDVPTAAGTSLSNHIITNIGSMQNRGFEFGLDTKVFDGGSRGFSWDANFNASTNRNELLTVNRPPGTLIRTGGVSGGVGSTVQVLEPGLPINTFYVYQHRSVNGKPVASGPDTAMYVDQNKDGIINDLDRRPYHTPAPRWMLGHTSNFRWAGFDAGATLRAYLGNYVYNNVASNLGAYSVLTQGNAPANLSASVLKYGFEKQQILSDVFVENASFFRIDNVTLGYTFPLRSAQQARIYGVVQNAFTSTKYTGVDPTAGLNGIDNNIYPRSRTFVGGLSLGF